MIKQSNIYSLVTEQIYVNVQNQLQVYYYHNFHHTIVDERLSNTCAFVKVLSVLVKSTNVCR